MPIVTQLENSLEIREDMTPGRRGFFLLLALFPLLAPYELLLRPGWRSFFNPLFLLSLLISLGAVFLSGFLAFAAFAGLSTLLRFDQSSRIFTYMHQAPIVALRRERIAFDAIDCVEIEKHDWSDGEPTYSLRVFLKDGRSYKSASFEALEQAQGAHYQIAGILSKV
jgi:hypothetical protein